MMYVISKRKAKTRANVLFVADRFSALQTRTGLHPHLAIAQAKETEDRLRWRLVQEPVGEEGGRGMGVRASAQHLLNAEKQKNNTCFLFLNINWKKELICLKLPLSFYNLICHQSPARTKTGPQK